MATLELQTILGASGTIGVPLARELRAYTDRVRLVSRNPKPVVGDEELVSADLSSPGEMDRAVAGSSIVYLVVGLEYRLPVWRTQWPALMRSALDACAKHGARLVFFDNMYMYDKSALGHMTEEAPVNPPSRKGEVRRQIADMLLKETAGGKVKALIARAADFYGPENTKSILVETLVKSMAKGKKGIWFGSAERKHSFTYTPDAAKATAILGNTDDAFGQVWHLPTCAPAPTVKQLAALFAGHLKAPEKPTVVPIWVVRVLGWFSPVMRELPEMLYQCDRDYVFDSGKFEKRFGFTPTAYEDGVKATVLSLAKQTA